MNSKDIVGLDLTTFVIILTAIEFSTLSASKIGFAPSQLLDSMRLVIVFKFEISI